MTVTINGSTGIDKVQDGTIVQADLATGVAGTGPAFSAYQSSGQTPSSNTWTKITFTSEEFDTNANYDTSTSRFTPTVAGYYQISASVQFATANYNVRTSLYKNGAVVLYGTSSSTGVESFVSGLAYLNGSTDYVEVYATTATSQATGPGQGVVYFQGVLVRAA